MQVNKITSPIAKLMLVEDMGYKKAQMPANNRPYCIFDKDKVDVFVKNGKRAIPTLVKKIKNAQTEDEIVEGLYIADRMIDSGVKNMDKLYYSAFSRFNNSRSANVQTFLSGVYRKTLNPDAFGPLVKMMCDNFKSPPKANFDSNEEVGGAVIEYLRDAVKQSKNNK